MPEPRRDQWGRYLLPDPHTGEERSWTRATTWAATVDDTFNITDWKMRMVAKGVAIRDDLRLLAASLDIDADKKELGRAARDALEAAGGSEGRNLGTALHGFTAQWDQGERPKVPAPYDRDIDAYLAACEVYGIVRYPLMVERIVCVPELGIAGTFDRIVQWPPSYFVADVKTGDDLKYSWPSIAIQLAIYANADFVWNADASEWERMPDVSRKDGLVIHLPAGKGRCDLYWVDLEAGWAATQLCADVRDWRKRDNLHRPFGVDLLGRSPVQPVLDLAGDGQGDSARKRRVASDAPPAEDSPKGVTANTDGDVAAPDGDTPDGIGGGDGSQRSAPDRPAPVPGSPAPAGGQVVLPYPVCKGCGHRYDAHQDPGDPRDDGCYECPCPVYLMPTEQVTT